MQVEVAEKAGACFGVNRSLDILKDCVLKYNRVVTLGDLIHNPITITELREKYGVVSVNSLEEAKKLRSDCVVVRSHGVPINIESKAKQLRLNLVDATCPHVKHVQKTAASMAKKHQAVVVIGKSQHPEVSGVCSYIKDNGAFPICVCSSEDLKNLSSTINTYSSIGVVSQTTQAIETFDNLVTKIQSNGLNAEIHNTICAATAKRQKCAKQLAKKVDAFVVVGGKNSSNTCHLADIVRRYCDNVFHIEKFDEINIEDLAYCKTVGLSAGASTPQNQIEDTRNFLLNFGKKSKH